MEKEWSDVEERTARNTPVWRTGARHIFKTRINLWDYLPPLGLPLGHSQLASIFFPSCVDNISLSHSL